MNTRFSPSLNGSLHLGHLYMAWINRTYAHMHGGKFILRFDDLAPEFAGEPTEKMSEWAKAAESLLREAGLAPDLVTYVSSYSNSFSDFPRSVEGKNKWIRPEDFEGHENLTCSPLLVEARVKADIAEEIGAVIRGEELMAEMQLYEFINSTLNGKPRELIYLPRLRVKTQDQVTTISKTYGNLQLRDLFKLAPPSDWLSKVKEIALINPEKPLEWDNVNRNPIFDISQLPII